MIPETLRLLFEPLVHVLIRQQEKKQHNTTQLLQSTHASAQPFLDSFEKHPSIKWDWKYLKLLRERLQVVLVEFHNVFDEVLDGHGVHVICRRIQKASRFYETRGTVSTKKIHCKYFFCGDAITNGLLKPKKRRKKESKRTLAVDEIIVNVGICHLEHSYRRASVWSEQNHTPGVFDSLGHYRRGPQLSSRLVWTNVLTSVRQQPRFELASLVRAQGEICFSDVHLSNCCHRAVSATSLEMH